MKITYIFHSGFLVELDSCSLIFDYFQGRLPALRPDKPLVVFSSHAHHDHYNPEVFRLARSQGVTDITAVLSKDISPRKYPKDIPVITAACHREYALPCGLSVRTLLSTDCGVAYVVGTPEGTIYHAGDLNDWYWAGESEQWNKQMAGNYRHEIGLLKGQPIDCAFVPLDPRLEAGFDRGLAYFLKNVTPRAVFPMHYWETPEIIEQFLRENPQYSEIVKNTEHYQEGNAYEF